VTKSMVSKSKSAAHKKVIDAKINSYNTLALKQREESLQAQLEACRKFAVEVVAQEKKPTLTASVRVIQAVADFYLVLMAETLFDPNTTFAGRMALYNRAKEATFAPLAAAFFDYIVATCAGELRHAHRCANQHYDGFPTGFSHHRASASAFALQYEPRSTLKACLKSFTDGEWQNGYGGEAWAKIAKAGLMYKEQPDIVFIDHCVDLSHNSGTFLDKGIVFLEEDITRYVLLLESKKYAKKPIDFLTALISLKAPVSLGMVPLIGKMAEDDEVVRKINLQADFRYDPVVWGDLPFPFVLVKSFDEDAPDDSDSDDDSDSEDNSFDSEDNSFESSSWGEWVEDANSGTGFFQFCQCPACQQNKAATGYVGPVAPSGTGGKNGKKSKTSPPGQATLTEDTRPKEGEILSVLGS
jgi:hypothetical protein